MVYKVVIVPLGIRVFIGYGFRPNAIAFLSTLNVHPSLNRLIIARNRCLYDKLCDSNENEAAYEHLKVNLLFKVEFGVKYEEG